MIPFVVYYQLFLVEVALSIAEARSRVVPPCRPYPFDWHSRDAFPRGHSSNCDLPF
jgi:hypothetical protein